MTGAIILTKLAYSLQIICKINFIYGDVIYDEHLHKSLSNRIESATYKTALSKAGAIKGSSWEIVLK